MLKASSGATVGLVALGVCAVMLGVATAHSGDQARTRRTRVIDFTGRPIAESLRPDDDIVVIREFGESIGVDPIDGHDQALAVVASSTRLTMAVVDVTGVAALLANEGSSVQTKFVARVVEVLSVGAEVKAGDRVQQGQAIEFADVGGEVAIRGVIVRAEPVVDYPYPGRYFVVLVLACMRTGG